MQELVFSFQFVTPDSLDCLLQIYITYDQEWVNNFANTTKHKASATTKDIEIQLILNIKKASLASVLEHLISQSSTKLVWLLAWSFSLSLNNFLHQRSPQSLRLCHDIRRSRWARFPCQLAQVWFWCSFWPRSPASNPHSGPEKVSLPNVIQDPSNRLVI